MKLKHRNILIGLGLLAILPLALSTRRLEAVQGSVQQSANLATNPPRTWIRHYLPDDRYKITGHIWNLMTTQADTHYHRPDCPRMLEQSHDIAMGFYSKRDAEEAGYIPDPYCHPNFDASITIEGSSGGSYGAGRAAGQRVMLAGRTSSVVVPAGWTRTRSDVVGTSRIGLDTFRSKAGSGVGFVVLPMNNAIRVYLGNGLNSNSLRLVAPFIKKGMDDEAARREANSAGVRRTADNFDKQNFRDATVGGFRGVVVSDPQRQAGSIDVFMFMHANKIYMVMGQSMGDVSAFLSTLKAK